jgi:hypothetical protein
MGTLRTVEENVGHGDRDAKDSHRRRAEVDKACSRLSGAQEQEISCGLWQ